MLLKCAPIMVEDVNAQTNERERERERKEKRQIACYILDY